MSVCMLNAQNSYDDFFRSGFRDVCPEKDFEFSEHLGEIKEICALKLWNKKSFKFFKQNTELFKNVKAISLSINIGDFDFIEQLPMLEYISIGGKLGSNELNSLVSKLNSCPNIRMLEIIKLRSNEFPSELNRLSHVRSLNISNSTIEYFNIHLKLNVLRIQYNKKNIKYLYGDDIRRVQLVSNQLHSIPAGLSRSNNVESIYISDYTDFKVDCPIKGFYKLKIFNASGAKGLKVSRDCFENNQIREVWGNVPSEFHLNDINKDGNHD